MAEDYDVDIESEDGQWLLESWFKWDDQPNIPMPNLHGWWKKKVNMVAQAIVSQFPEGEMYSIQLQMTELEEPERDMHTSPHPAAVYKTFGKL